MWEEERVAHRSKNLGASGRAGEVSLPDLGSGYMNVCSVTFHWAIVNFPLPYFAEFMLGANEEVIKQ